MLKPLLDYILANGATYRWGHPLAVFVKKGGRSFNLWAPEQLAEFFKFLGVDAIEIPNWTELSVRMDYTL